MDKITKETLKAEFEFTYGHPYQSETEFRSAVEAEYKISDDEPPVFSGGDEPFVVLTRPGAITAGANQKGVARGEEADETAG